MRTPIVLLGPMAAGKSSIARGLASVLKLPRAPVDRLKWFYYFRAGYEDEAMSSCQNYEEAMAYIKPFELAAVEGVLQDFPSSVIDLGAGHSFYQDESLLARAKQLFADLKNVFLLLPCEDGQRSLAILSERLAKRNGREPDRYELRDNRYYVEHTSNFQLANHIIYTQDKTVEECVVEIQNKLT